MKKQKLIILFSMCFLMVASVMAQEKTEHPGDMG